jgi:HK97 gp10 family phage protein
MNKRFRLNVKGVFNAKGIQKDMMVGIDKGLTMLALSMQRRIRKKLLRPGSGRHYYYGRNGSQHHQASAPGESPAALSGNLVNSWQAAKKVRPRTEGGKRVLRMFPAHVGSAVKYGWYLEFGTKHIAARPYIEPTVSQMSKHADKIFRSQLNIGVAKANRRIT